MGSTNQFQISIASFSFSATASFSPKPFSLSIPENPNIHPTIIRSDRRLYYATMVDTRSSDTGKQPFINDTTNEPRPPAGAYGRMAATKYVSRFPNLIPASFNSSFRLSPGEHDEAEKEMVHDLITFIK